MRLVLVIIFCFGSAGFLAVLYDELSFYWKAADGVQDAEIDLQLKSKQWEGIEKKIDERFWAEMRSEVSSLAGLEWVEKLRYSYQAMPKPNIEGISSMVSTLERSYPGFLFENEKFSALEFAFYQAYLAKLNQHPREGDIMNKFRLIFNSQSQGSLGSLTRQALQQSLVYFQSNWDISESVWEYYFNLAYGIEESPALSGSEKAAIWELNTRMMEALLDCPNYNCIEEWRYSIIKQQDSLELIDQLYCLGEISSEMIAIESAVGHVVKENVSWTIVFSDLMDGVVWGGW